jgi:hypothetical protein
VLREGAALPRLSESTSDVVGLLVAALLAEQKTAQNPRTSFSDWSMQQRRRR